MNPFKPYLQIIMKPIHAINVKNNATKLWGGMKYILRNNILRNNIKKITIA